MNAMRPPASPRVLLASTMTLVFGLSLVAPAVPPAHAADATLVFAAYRAIIAYDAVRQDAAKLLTGALQGLRDALAKTGIAEPLGDLTAADATAAESEFQARFDRAAVLGQGKLTVTQLAYAAAAAMADVARSVDDGTYFYTPEYWKNQWGLGQGLTGISIVLMHWFGRWVVFRTTPYAPAEAAGLRPFDRIVAIDGRSTERMTYDDIDHLIGVEGTDRPAGTAVELTVQRPGQTAPLTLSVVLQVLGRRIPEQHRLLAGNLGYIWIRSFRLSGDAAQFRRSLVELQRSGMRGLILDLRAFSGPNANAFVNAFLVANALLPAGATVQMVASHAEDFQARPESCPAVLHDSPPDGSGLIFISRLPSPCVYETLGGTLLDPSTPLVVLVSGDTRGASVLLSAAIQGARRGKLVGERTYGSSSWVDFVALPGGARIQVKTHVVATGRGAVLTPKAGVQPDVPLAMTAADLDRGVDSQLQRAMEEWR